MNDHQLNDPRLESLEAYLSSLSPRLASDEQRELLYQCAFAAGEQAAKQHVRRWRTATLALSLLTCGLLFSIPSRVDLPLEPGQPAGSGLTAHAKTTVNEVIATQTRNDSPPATTPLHEPARVQLDAWERRPDQIAEFSDALLRFQQLEPAARANTMIAIERSL